MKSKILDIYKKEGVLGITRKVFLFPFRFVWYKLGLRNWWLQDHWLLGKLTEIIYGDEVKINDIKIFINDPVISVPIKCRFILNRYETEERDVVQKFLDTEIPVVEFGGSIGVISCITNRILKFPEKHIVIEANSNLIPILRKNQNLNNCRFEIINKAVSYDKENVVFYIHDKFIGGSVCRKTTRSISVPVITLKKIIDDNNFKKINLICDIEGTEIEMISKDLQAIKDHVLVAVIGFHPGISKISEIEQAKEIMLRSNFDCVYDKKFTCVFLNKTL